MLRVLQEEKFAYNARRLVSLCSLADHSNDDDLLPICAPIKSFSHTQKAEHLSIRLRMLLLLKTSCFSVEPTHTQAKRSLASSPLSLLCASAPVVLCIQILRFCSLAVESEKQTTNEREKEIYYCFNLTQRKIARLR